MNSSLMRLTTPQGRIPAIIAAAGEHASMPRAEFCAANIRNS
jgi:hypothetical protein